MEMHSYYNLEKETKTCKQQHTVILKLTMSLNQSVVHL